MRLPGIIVAGLVIVATTWCGHVFAAGDGTTIKKLQFDPNLVSQARVAKPLAPITNTKIKPIIAYKIRPITPAQKPAKPKGPDPSSVLDLSDSIDDTELLEDLGTASGWDPHLIFQDKAANHVFYYVPREILLRRDSQGYRLSVQYNVMAEAGQPSVMLTAEIEAPQRMGDVKLLKAILRKALGLKASDPLQLKSLPAVGATADMEALAAGLSLSKDRIHLTAPAYLKQSFRLTLALTQDEVEEVLAQIAREGLAGTLKVDIEDKVLPVPIRIQYSNFTGERVDGFDQWLAGKPVGRITNLTDFPVRLTSINAYRMRNGQLVRIAKKLKKTQPIPPGRSRSFKLPAVNKVLGSNLLVSWLGTELDLDCTACIQRIDQKIRQGVALAQGSRIKLEAIPSVFSEFGIYKLLIHVRSPYFVAGGKEVKEREIELTEDENHNDSLVIYIPGDRGNDALLFRYRIQLVTESGESIEENEWHDARNLSQYFGSAQLRMLVGDENGQDASPDEMNSGDMIE